MNLLHIIATPRGEKSRTLAISQNFLDALSEKHSNLQIDNLNVFEANLPTINGEEADSKYSLMGGNGVSENAQSFWDTASQLATEFLSYDMYLISTPMWNFTVPYALKQYIDLIIQPGIMFQYSETGVEGLAKGKKMVCVTSRGADYGLESPMNSLDYLEQYIRAIFGFTGIIDISFINAQALDYTPEVTEQSLNYAKAVATSLADAY